MPASKKRSSVLNSHVWGAALLILVGGVVVGCGGEDSGGADGGDGPSGPPLGSECDQGSDCASGHCWDGVCCETTCDGVCQVCDSTGSCVPIADGEDPDNECALCQACDGQGACRNLGATETPPGECNAGADDTCDGTCNGAGGCDFPLEGTSCGECSTCDGAGACGAVEVGTDPNGDCPGFCQDCDGAGACANAVGRNPHDDCGTDPDCAGTCNAGGTCDYPLDTPCGTPACVDNEVVIDTCDGAGACQPDAAPEACAPYRCIEAPPDALCTNQCVSNADCAPSGAVCDLRSICTGLESGSCFATALPLPLDCGAAGGNELQLAIDSVCGADCHLLIEGTCDAVAVTNKAVYIDGQGTATLQGAAGAVVTVTENGGEADVALTGVTVMGVPGGAAGINAGSSDLDAADVWLLDGTVSSANEGAGVFLTNTRLCMLGARLDGNTGAGINANSSTVIVQRSAIAGNGGAGMNLVNTSFRIVNTFVVGNGGLGVNVSSIPPLTIKVFRHNTVADNVLGGMDCAGVGGATTVEQSLFFNGAGSDELVSGCTAQESDIPDADFVDVQDACSDANAVPLFEVDYHLQAGSTCIDTVPCIGAVPEDFDGDPRPTGASCEPGADER